MPGALDFVVVLAVLYLFECVRVVRPGETIVDRRFGGRPVVRRAVFYPNDRWGWVLLNLFAPNGPVFHLKPMESLDRNRFDRKALRRRLDQIDTATSWIATLSTIQLTLSFFVFPVWAYFLGITRALLYVAPIVFLVSALCTMIYVRSARRLGLDRSRLDLYGNCVKLLLYPVAVFRACDLLTPDSLHEFDPIAVVAELAGKEPAAKLGAREYVQLKFSGSESEYPAARLSLLDWFDGQERLGIQGLVKPPVPIDAGSRTYCPRCGTQYQLASGVCTDCPGVALEPFAQS